MPTLRSRRVLERVFCAYVVCVCVCVCVVCVCMVCVRMVCVVFFCMCVRVCGVCACVWCVFRRKGLNEWSMLRTGNVKLHEFNSIKKGNINTVIKSARRLANEHTQWFLQCILYRGSTCPKICTSSILLEELRTYIIDIRIEVFLGYPL